MFEIFLDFQEYIFQIYSIWQEYIFYHFGYYAIDLALVFGIGCVFVYGWQKLRKKSEKFREWTKDAW